MGREPVLHPIDQGMARHWVKKRLASIYPELRNNPGALDAAYRSLGAEEADESGNFEIILPG